MNAFLKESKLFFSQSVLKTLLRSDTVVFSNIVINVVELSLGQTGG